MAPGFKSFHVERVCAASPQILKAKVKTYLRRLTGTWLLGPEDYLSSQAPWDHTFLQCLIERKVISGLSFPYLLLAKLISLL